MALGITTAIVNCENCILTQCCVQSDKSEIGRQHVQTVSYTHLKGNNRIIVYLVCRKQGGNHSIWILPLRKYRPALFQYVLTNNNNNKNEHVMSIT